MLGASLTMARHPRTAERAELAAFLKTRRARLTPVDVGLAQTLRRRTPGLRREEVAQAAGVGVTWYTWLEQGRQIDVSAHFLEQVARALRLDTNERAHLFTLAQNRPPPPPSAPAYDITPDIARMLESFAGPAYIATSCLDVLAWNSVLSAVFGDLEPLPAQERNTLWLMFASPEHRSAIPNWDEAAQAMLARFRVEFGRDRTDPRFLDLIQRLQLASAEFRQWWPEHNVTWTSEKPKRFTSPLVGEMALEQTTFVLESAPGVRLVVYAAADAESGDRVAKLHQHWLGMHAPAKRIAV